VRRLARAAARDERLVALSALAATIGCAIWGATEFYKDTIMVSRNFYGVLRVQEIGAQEQTRRRSLIHGTILHGNQYLDPVLSRQATTYYTETSGIGRLLDVLNPRREPLRVGVIGLGTGSLAAFDTSTEKTAPLRGGNDWPPTE